MVQSERWATIKDFKSSALNIMQGLCLSIGHAWTLSLEKKIWYWQHAPSKSDIAFETTNLIRAPLFQMSQGEHNDHMYTTGMMLDEDRC